MNGVFSVQESKSQLQSDSRRDIVLHRILCMPPDLECAQYEWHTGTRQSTFTYVASVVNESHM